MLRDPRFWHMKYRKTLFAKFGNTKIGKRKQKIRYVPTQGNEVLWKKIED